MLTSPAEVVDLTNPACEPSAEALQALSERAFARVRAENDRAQEQMQQQIASYREEVLRKLAASNERRR